GGGWSLGGRPLWAGVRRLERGRLLRLAPGEGGLAAPSSGEASPSGLLSLGELAALPGRGLGAAAGAGTVVDGGGGVAEWARAARWRAATTGPRPPPTATAWSAAWSGCSAGGGLGGPSR